ncbi:teneurin-3 [Acetobacterium sp. K1/6]|uniref:teneurin-3 n=1 Tax=Acetobacterium sp. K1/6 TaxID=3055467 RepID=UPI002ACAEF04|nr:teneurin-3 [Acetobacterium sp. K1/6]MDZ5723418.1 teneurin-3 [Acetobacterium sp. K1/6]
MSRRTSEANKAICKAWNDEQQLVQEGKGTRDWTPEQQKDILEKGKAYDEKGKAFEGHHMLNVERFPEHQGNPQNVEFLSRSEHLQAHDGNYQNPTCGYFDYITGETEFFENGNLEPCVVIELSNPITNISDLPLGTVSNKKVVSDEEKVIDDKTKDNSEIDDKTDNKIIFINSAEPITPKSKVELKKKSSFGDKILRATVTISKFSEQHPVATKIIMVGVPIVIGVASDVASKKVSSNSKKNQLKVPTKQKPVISSQSNTLEKASEFVAQVENVCERKSPLAHMVGSHEQRYHGVMKKKAAYSRGGKE